MAFSLDEEIAKGIIWILYFIGLYFSLYWLTVLLFKPKYNTKIRRKIFPEVTIIIPLWQEEKSVTTTLDSVFALDYPKDKLKVICVNDGSTDKTLELLKAYQKKKKFTIIDQKNQGKHAALNAGLKKTNSPYFVCLDADSMPESHALKRLIEEFDSDKVGAVMPMMRVYQPQNVIQRVQWLEYSLNVFYKYIMGKLDCIHVIPGPFSIYRTDIVKDLGGFRHGHKTEDFEITLRLQQNHYKIKQSLEAAVYTKSPATLKNFTNQRLRWYHGTLLNLKDYRFLFFNKEYGEYGLFQMPFVALTGFFAVLGFFTLFYLFIKQTINLLRTWYLTNFDFWTYLTNYRWNMTFLDFDWQFLFLIGFLMTLTFFIVSLALETSRERIKVLRSMKYYVMFLYYLFIYSFVLSFVWLRVLYRILMRKDNKWSKVN